MIRLTKDTKDVNINRTILSTKPLLRQLDIDITTQSLFQLQTFSQELEYEFYKGILLGLLDQLRNIVFKFKSNNNFEQYNGILDIISKKIDDAEEEINNEENKEGDESDFDEIKEIVNTETGLNDDDIKLIVKATKEETSKLDNQAKEEIKEVAKVTSNEEVKEAAKEAVSNTSKEEASKPNALDNLLNELTNPKGNGTPVNVAVLGTAVLGGTGAASVGGALAGGAATATLGAALAGVVALGVVVNAIGDMLAEQERETLANKVEEAKNAVAEAIASGKSASEAQNAGIEVLKGTEGSVGPIGILVTGGYVTPQDVQNIYEELGNIAVAEAAARDSAESSASGTSFDITGGCTSDGEEPGCTSDGCGSDCGSDCSSDSCDCGSDCGSDGCGSDCGSDNCDSIPIECTGDICVQD